MWKAFRNNSDYSKKLVVQGFKVIEKHILIFPNFYLKNFLFIICWYVLVWYINPSTTHGCLLCQPDEMWESSRVAKFFFFC